MMADLQAAYLWAQLEAADTINLRRLALWHRYASALEPLGGLMLPSVPATCQHNAHMFYVKLRDIDDRDAFIRHMKAADILTVFHYIPLRQSGGPPLAGSTAAIATRVAKADAWCVYRCFII